MGQAETMRQAAEQDIFKSASYRRSRTAYHIQCVTEYLVTLLVADAFLAKLLKSIGMSDALIGIVSSLISLAFLAQLVTILLIQHTRNVKKTVVLIDIASMLCFMCTFWVPFMPVAEAGKSVLVFVTILGGFMLKNLQVNLYYKWGQSFVRPGGRGTFSARNEAISLLVGIVFSLVMGYLVDHYEKMGDLSTCFIIIACVIAGLTVLDLFMLLSIKNYSTAEAVKQQKPFKDVINHTLGNKNFRNVVIMISLFEFGRYMTVGFLGTYKTEDLLLSVSVVQLINIGGSVLRTVFSAPCGKWADRTSFANVYRKGLYLCAFAFLLLAFTARNTWWLIIGYTVCFNVSQAAIPGNANNMTYSYVPIDYFVQAQAIRCSIAGVIGFGASFIGSAILSAVQAAGNTVLGLPVNGQQLLAVISLTFVVGAIVFNKIVVSKQEVMKQ